MTRLCVAAAAVAVLAWLGVMERNLRLQEKGLAATAQQDFARADQHFRRAGLLNPDTTPELQRAYVHALRGRRDRAIATVQEVLRREPENRNAWGLLRGFVPDGESPIAKRARAELRRLSPLDARR